MSDSARARLSGAVCAIGASRATGRKRSDEVVSFETTYLDSAGLPLDSLPL